MKQDEIINSEHSLKERTQKMIKFLNDRIEIEELENLFAQKTS